MAAIKQRVKNLGGLNTFRTHCIYIYIYNEIKFQPLKPFINYYINGLMAGLISIIILNQQKAVKKMKFILCQQVALSELHKDSGFPDNGSTQSSAAPDFETCKRSYLSNEIIAFFILINHHI